jgi:hypothetical protein
VPASNASFLSPQLRQLGDIRRDPPGLSNLRGVATL